MNRIEELLFDQFMTLKPKLKEWGELVDRYLINEVISDMINDHLIKISPKFRLKDDKSFLFKALYRRKNYSNPIENIEDKVGTRIVVLKSNDIREVQKRILAFSGWQAIQTKNIDQEIEDKPNIFDYQSSHIVVRPNNFDAHFSPDISNSLTCEIQIRTLLQHAFAEVSHDSTYKGPYKNDKEILRSLAKAMALMEATDDYFCDIFSLMTDEKRYYSNYLKELITLFRTFKEDFNNNEINHFLTESIFELLELQDVSIQDLEVFVTKNQDDLKKYIKPENGMLFQQPSVVLVLYYLINHRTFLSEKWTLNNDMLKNIFKTTNTAYH